MSSSALFKARRCMKDASNARLEAVQWIAFFCMVADHVAVFFLHENPLLRGVGRLAFPLFVLVFSMRLAAVFDLNPRRGLLAMGQRLVISGSAAQAAFALMTTGLTELNVMFTLLLVLCAISLGLRERDFLGLPWSARCFVAGVLLAWASSFVDYKQPGIVLALGLFSYFRWQERGSLIVALSGLVAMSVSNPIPVAFLAAPVGYLLLTTSVRGLSAPRLAPYLFYWLYPAHLLAILVGLVVLAWPSR